MFLINKAENRVQKISEKTFKELGFREREHLQEWIANNSEILGEELLNIQKEFAEFDETKERLDLLALDKKGNLVIIENKLDDSGRDVTWQILKYASYCSSLKTSEIVRIYQDYLLKNGSSISAEHSIAEFLEDSDIEEIVLNTGLTQRMMLVAGSFRKEVTSTVIWLLNYKLRIQCFQATPYALGEQLFLNVEQIIPTKEAEEYTISMAAKTQEDIQAQEQKKSIENTRIKFWTELLNVMNTKSDLFQNIGTSKYNWIGAGAGTSGVTYNFVVSKKAVRAEIYIDVRDAAQNERIFDYLYSKKEQIEHKFGGSLGWERLEGKRACRVRIEDNSLDLIDSNTWSESIELITDYMTKLYKSSKLEIKNSNN